jgi:glycosyltransferase involved in cell wall biosynthesis
MKLLFYTKPPFLDCDLPYLNSQKENISQLYIIIDLPPYFLQSSILNISDQFPKSGIIKASAYKDFFKFKDFIDLDKTFIINRTKKRFYNLPNLILDFKLLWLIYKLKPSIIHSSVFYDFQELLLYFFKKKTILTVHDPFLHSGEGNVRKYFFRKIGFALLDNFVILNKKQRSEFIVSNKLKNKNVFDSTLSIYDNYKLYSKLPSEKLPLQYILFFGRISPYKGINILLEAMRNVHQSHPDVNLIIAGNGKYYFDKTEFEQLDYIEFRNRYIPNEELVNLIDGSLLVVCPYTDATQSGVVMTSYTFCKPVVATNVGGLSEMVIDNVTGVLVEPNNVIELQKKIVELISNKKRLNDMKINIYNHYHIGEQSWVKICDELLVFYKTIN